MNNYKIAALVLLISVLVGCSNHSAIQYYKAVETASVSNSETQMARFKALRDMAKGDTHAGVAAVMALAMLKTEVIRPAYIESEALSYTKALAAPLTGIAALMIQADLSAQNNKENNKTARAQIDANSAEQQGLFEAFAVAGAAGGVTTDLAIGGLVDIAGQSIDGNVDISGQSIDGNIDISGQSIDGNVNIAGQSIDANVDISGQSIDGVVDISAFGYQTFENIVIDENDTMIDILNIPGPVIP
jgi:hypothetical protein